jgi:hypothetical protein
VGNKECTKSFGGGNLLEKNPLGIIRERWKNNLKMGLQITGCEVTRWMNYLMIMTNGGPLY